MMDDHRLRGFRLAQHSAVLGRESCVAGHPPPRQAPGLSQAPRSSVVRSAAPPFRDGPPALGATLFCTRVKTDAPSHVQPSGNHFHSCRRSGSSKAYIWQLPPTTNTST